MTPAIADAVRARGGVVGVFHRLGGGPLRHGRGVAFWREGDGFNVSFDEERGLFFDHAAGVGGDVIDLVETVLGTTFAGALDWLGINRQNGPSVDVRSRVDAEHEARRLMALRDAMIDAADAQQDRALADEAAGARGAFGRMVAAAEIRHRLVTATAPDLLRLLRNFERERPNYAHDLLAHQRRRRDADEAFVRAVLDAMVPVGAAAA